MVNFDFTTQVGRAAIQKVVSDRAVQVQKELHHARGTPIQIIKNRPLVNTAIDFANKSVDLHKIMPADQVSDTKRYAHLCFWMIKLTPISYIPKSLFSRLNYQPVLKIDRDYVHFPVNTHISYLTFLSLYATSTHGVSGVKQAIKRMYETDASIEVMKSLRFFNYSSRSLAMYLESLTQDKMS